MRLTIIRCKFRAFRNLGKQYFIYLFIYLSVYMMFFLLLLNARENDFIVNQAYSAQV